MVEVILWIYREKQRTHFYVCARGWDYIWGSSVETCPFVCEHFREYISSICTGGFNAIHTRFVYINKFIALHAKELYWSLRSQKQRFYMYGKILRLNFDWSSYIKCAIYFRVKYINVYEFLSILESKSFFYFGCLVCVFLLQYLIYVLYLNLPGIFLLKHSLQFLIQLLPMQCGLSAKK